MNGLNSTHQRLPPLFMIPGFTLPYTNDCCARRKSTKYRYCTWSSTWSWSIYRIRFYGRLLSRRFSNAFTRMTGMIHESGIRHARLGVALLRALSTAFMCQTGITPKPCNNGLIKLNLVTRIYLVTHH